MYSLECKLWNAQEPRRDSPESPVFIGDASGI